MEKSWNFVVWSLYEPCKFCMLQVHQVDLAEREIKAKSTDQ